jgi:hypothetical protein
MRNKYLFELFVVPDVACTRRELGPVSDTTVISQVKQQPKMVGSPRLTNLQLSRGCAAGRSDILWKGVWPEIENVK